MHKIKDTKTDTSNALPLNFEQESIRQDEKLSDLRRSFRCCCLNRRNNMDEENGTKGSNQYIAVQKKLSGLRIILAGSDKMISIEDYSIANRLFSTSHSSSLVCVLSGRRSFAKWGCVKI